MKTCFACHEKAKVSDLVFTHYAPEAQNVYLADPPYGNGKCQKTGVTGVLLDILCHASPLFLSAVWNGRLSLLTQSRDRFIGASIKVNISIDSGLRSSVETLPPQSNSLGLFSP